MCFPDLIYVVSSAVHMRFGTKYSLISAETSGLITRSPPGCSRLYLLHLRQNDCSCICVYATEVCFSEQSDKRVAFSKGI